MKTLGERIEVAIYKYVEAGGRGQPRDVTVVDIVSTEPSSTTHDVADAVERLWRSGHVRLEKWWDELQQFVSCSDAADIKKFLYGPPYRPFRLTITAEGRADYERRTLPEERGRTPPSKRRNPSGGLQRSKRAFPTTFKSAFATYKIDALLGEGGVGRVFAVHDEDQQVYALKVLKPDGVTTQARKRFKNEIAFGRLRHSNIIEILDFGVSTMRGRDLPFYVMPLYPQTLHDLLKAGLSPDKALVIFSQLLDGVEAAHLNGVWHRDLKPKNVLYDPEADRAIVADFGVAHFAADIQATVVETKPGERVGNYQYAAPEQKVRGDIDHRADIFALGLMLNEMFTGEILHGVGYKRVSDVAPGYVWIDDLVERMVQQSPAARPSSIDEVKKALISRQLEFISRQRLSELRNRVVPTREAEDRLVVDPIRPTGCDYDEGRLHVLLNHTPNGPWMHAFKSYGDAEYIPGPGYDDFHFGSNRILVAAQESNAQIMFDQIKQRIEVANRSYKKHVEGLAHQQEMNERRRLQEETAKEDQRRRVLAKLIT
ncbi:MAG TPA: serine/threonine-protein kinase [Bryobacteraceae bacterium]|jgi:serine/threonine protein kinase|nr:serine/threonine-protein kinase [Bryobacteraceae bacterium]